MCKASGMHVVKSIHHLVEICAGDFLGKFASFGDKIEKLSSSNILEDDGKAAISAFVPSFVSSVFPDSEQTD